MTTHRRGGRRELKFLISYAEYLQLKSRVSALLNYDVNAGENGYFIRSVYFDDICESAYYQKLAGFGERKKYRLRSYNKSPDYITLERKEKFNLWVDKENAVIDRDVCNSLIAGDFSVLEGREEQVCREVYSQFRASGFHSSVIVDYHREAFVYPVSNLRITFDKNLHAGGITGFSMFEEDDGVYVTVPAFINNSVILEVKYDEYVPEFVRSIIPSFTGVPISISKYCRCKGINKAITS